MWAIKYRPSVEFWASERRSISFRKASPCKQTLWGGGNWHRKFFLHTPPPTLTSLPQSTHSTTYILFACFRFPHSNLDSKVRLGGQPEGTTWLWFACSINKTFSGLIKKFGLSSIQPWVSGFTYKKRDEGTKGGVMVHIALDHLPPRRGGGVGSNPKGGTMCRFNVCSHPCS